MKRYIVILLGLAIILCGCSSKSVEVARDEIVSVYEAAGYSVKSGVYEDQPDSGMASYVQAEHTDGDYIHFAFFDSEADAKEYEKNMDHPVMKGLFSVIFGDPVWERIEVYGNVVVTYSNPAFIKPFQELLRSK